MTAYHPQDPAVDRAQPAHHALAAAALAEAVRTRLKRPPPPLPRADGALLKAAVAIMLCGAGATGLALYLGHREVPLEPVISPARIGAVSLMVPQDLTGTEADDSSRLVGMVRLRLDWPSLGPAQTGPGALQNRQRLLVTLSPPDKVNEPQTQLSVYARFLTPTVWSNPGGLVVRGFRKGSPYEGDELYVSVPDGRGFAARCPIEAARTGTHDLDEPCRVTFRHRGLDVNLRFPRAIIADWELMLGGVRRTIDGLIR
ncbi:MAG: hypothetical protein Q8S58_21325 [Bosea sp. (in: a-proteobacteria)]|uniref:hypothetical protein n=1 Tax=Bosea sp. (in: a-proteobacteria) TaxID=1871050 RepID=UPI00273246B3|nr:hypothetical protein [Bosea sp. (in: a-proteobacteria)]MDP3255356.1 hypothetical protein [Bosea sp. (in: a-proteobacteria)]MDP3321673.1 hypothetical protein [Bosea sp. (in: a-proteobacteria)]